VGKFVAAIGENSMAIDSQQSTASLLAVANHRDLHPARERIRMTWWRTLKLHRFPTGKARSKVPGHDRTVDGLADDRVNTRP
jgi:hypothetical protein